MSNPYTGTVAAALRKSQLLLELAPAQGLQQGAVEEAAVLQLWRAYRAFLCELAFQLQLGTEPQTSAELARDVKARGQASSEAAELVALEEDPGSWLSGLQAAWQQLWQFSAAPPPGQAAEAGRQIPLVDLGSSPGVALDFALLAQWRAALAELVQRQRAHMEEW